MQVCIRRSASIIETLKTIKPFTPEIGQNVRIIGEECHPDFLGVVAQINLIMDDEDIELIYQHPTKGEVFTWMKLEDLTPAESERLRLTL